MLLPALQYLPNNLRGKRDMIIEQIVSPYLKSAQGDEMTESEDVTASDEIGGGDFEELLRASISANNTKTEVNEEELFAGIVEQKVGEESDEARVVYNRHRQTLALELRRSDGLASVEEVALRALEQTVAGGDLDKSKAEEISGVAFLAAQLDGVSDALYDSRGSATDPSIAVASVDVAVSKAMAHFSNVQSGDVVSEPRSLDSEPTGGVLKPYYGGSSGDGDDYVSNSSDSWLLTSGQSTTSSEVQDASAENGTISDEDGFFWTSRSEKDGKLAVALPSSMNSGVDRVEIHSDLPPNVSSYRGEGVLEQDGSKFVYRFEHSGQAYGASPYVVSYHTDGTYNVWAVDSLKGEVVRR